MGANDFVSKPYDKTELGVRTACTLRLKEAQDSLRRHQAELEQLVELRTAMLRQALQEAVEAQRSANQAQLDTVQRLATAAEYKDKITALHIERMSEYAAILARGLTLAPGDVELIQHASRMHDVGKIGIPDAILRKPSGLDAAEWQVMRQHTKIGDRILAGSQSRLLQAGQLIAMSHHEWWDGSGYPTGLRGDAIPFWGRICAVADAFDAITSERPYKHAFSNDEAYEILLAERGTRFDPRVVDVFFERIEEILAIQHQYRDEILKGRPPSA